MLLKECSGFNDRAAAEWEWIKHGIEFLEDSTISSHESSCYLCFSKDEDVKSLALRTIRARQYTSPACFLTHSRALKYFLFFEPSMITSEAHVLDIMGGYLFRAVEDFRVIPTVSNHASYLRVVFISLSNFDSPHSKLINRVFKTKDTARDNFKLTIGLCAVRDCLEIYKRDSREIQSDVMERIIESLRTLSDWGVAGLSSQGDSQSIAAALEAIRPKIKSDLMDEWESTVLALYNHRRPAVKPKSAMARSGDRKTRSKVKSYADMELDEFDDDIKQSDESIRPLLVVDNWLQCDQCSKWRLVDANQLKKFKSSLFQCFMIEKSCSDPSDDIGEPDKA